MVANPMSEIKNIKKRLNDIEKKISDIMIMLSNINRSDIDYLAMELDVDLDADGEE